MKSARKLARLLSVFGLFIMVVAFQNCGGQMQFSSTTPIAAATSVSSVELSTGAVNVGASRDNPPLDLFFVIDNSGSMLGHQINLGNAFSSVFQSNSTNLSNFDVNVYVFSTASTYNPSYVGQIPAAGITSSLPLYANVTSLLAIPGSIFGFSQTTAGVFGTAPYTLQISPSALLGNDPTTGAVTQSLFIGKKGTQSDQAYQAKIASLTSGFQSRLAYLNPTNQLAYEPLTDVSSGLCSVARVLKHSSSFVKAGDSAAFVIVSDDNDRLNTRNPNGNQCVESVIGSNEVVDGACGHVETDFSYDSSNSVTYYSDSKFNYQSGTQINYSYPSSSTCVYSYTSGYKYSYSLVTTALKTTVMYNKCTLMADGTCVNTQPGSTQTISGSYAGANGTCTQDMSALVASPVSGTAFSCVESDSNTPVTGTGVDSASNGYACSTTALNQIAASQPDVSSLVCTITGANTVSASATGQTLNSCNSFCSGGAGTTHPNCVVTSSSNVSTNSSIKFAGVNGLTCASQCPAGFTCGTGTIGSFITSLQSGATCSTPTAIVSTLQVAAGANSDSSALTCASPLGSLAATVGGAAVCSGASTVQSCIASLQTGTTTISPCAVATGDTATLAAPVNVTCSTSCASSGGLCSAATYSTVGDFVAKTKAGRCASNANAGVQKLSLQFNAGIGTTASCSSKCSDTLSGSCDGMGYGATDGSTISDYIQNKLGGSTTCTSSSRNVVDSASIAVPASATAAACTTMASPIFIASDSAHPATNAVNYVAGDVNHKAADLQSYIVSQSAAVFGANNMPAVAVITHLANDSLAGTDVGTDYINLASAMGSNQVSSILGNYAQSLASVSNFIITSTQNSYVLSVPSGSQVVSVSLVRSGQATSQAISSSLWSWSGSTLSVSSSLKLQIGDELSYQYR